MDRLSRWAWLVLWLWPAFFVVHGVVVFPDFVFAALGVAALLVSRPRSAWLSRQEITSRRIPWGARGGSSEIS
jgi:hypothetical protein